MRALGLITLIVLISGTALATQSKRVAIVRSPKIRALAHAFRSGKLPEPARQPKGTIDQQAATLAKAVAAGDDASTASLYAAILAAGYGVRDTDKSVMQTTEQGQGLVIESSEVAAMAKLYGEDYGVTLAHLSESFTRSVPQLKDVPLANDILEGIRAAAKSKHAATRFWAQFVVEMGKNSAVPYDLLKQIDPAKTRLDAVQSALILTRLTGDLAVVEKKPAAHHARRSTPGPCDVGEVGDLILDYNALASTTLFGFLMNRLGGGFERYGKAAGLANVVLTIFKFIISYASLDVEITMDAEMLVRTKSTTPGERRTLTAKLKMDPGKWQMINCLRPYLNEAGLDVDVPEEGPLAGVKVNWVMVMGGNNQGWWATVEDNDGLAFFDAVAGAERSPGKQITNGEGVSQIYVVGFPQKTDLSKRKVFEVHKAAGVRLDIQLKTMRIVDTKQAMANIMDIAGNAFSFLTGDAAGGIVGTATETLYRSNWYSAQPFYFMVKDWEPCTTQWQGTITYRVLSTKEGTAEGPASTSYWNDNRYYESRAQLDGRRTDQGEAIARVEAHASEVKEWGGRGKGPCYRQTDETQTVRGQTTETTTSFSIIYHPRTKEYTVSAPAPVVIGTGVHTIDSQVKGTCNNPYNKSFTRSDKIESFQLSDDAPTLIGRGRVDPNNPDEFSGSATTEHVTGGGVKKTVTIEWNLRRCSDQ